MLYWITIGIEKGCVEITESFVTWLIITGKLNEAAGDIKFEIFTVEDDNSKALVLRDWYEFNVILKSC